MSEKICGIYKITNLINGKIYIGQSKDIYKRWKEHKTAARKKTGRANYPLYSAIKKYKIENFSFEIVEICTFEESNEKEKYWIASYNSLCEKMGGYGYNLTIGGQISNTYVGNDVQGKRVYQYDLFGNYIKEYRNQHKAAKAVGLKASASICQAIKKNGTAGGYQWRFEKYKNIPPHQKNYKCKKVFQYTLEGDFIRSFNSCAEATDFIGCSDTLIQLCCSNGCKTGKGFRWSYSYSKHLPPLKSIVQPTKWKEVALVSKDEKIINIFPCAKIASEETGVSYRAIQHCLCGECKTAQQQIFKYTSQLKGGEEYCKRK